MPMMGGMLLWGKLSEIFDSSGFAILGTLMTVRFSGVAGRFFVVVFVLH
jgi:hypothetical protein